MAALFCFGLVLEVSTSVSAGDVRDVGGQAPPIDVQQLLQAPGGATATLESLRGKVVVIEFWATWCVNCIKEIPSFNALADEVKDEPVVFIAVTDEDEARVRPFLAKTPIRGWIGLNTSGSMIKSYGIHTGNQQTDAERPMTVVIRADGIVDARLRPTPGLPFPIKSENLINLAEGRPSGLKSSRIVFSGEVHDARGKPIRGAEVVAREYIDERSWLQINSAGAVLTDEKGHFKIDVEQELAFFSGHPIFLEVTHKDFALGRLGDFRSLSETQQRDLHVGLGSLDHR